MDDIIANYNLFMACYEIDKKAFGELPKNYSFRLCKRDELDIWKRLCVEKDEYIDFMTDYFEKVYRKDEDEFFKRCTFVCTPEGIPVGTCYIWRSYGKVNTIGFLRVLPEYEGKGIGRALLTHILKDADCPIYLHTHPIAYRAIKMYSDFGFQFLTNHYIGHRQNHFYASLDTLREVMPEKIFNKLKTTLADDYFLNTVLSSTIDEF